MSDKIICIIGGTGFVGHHLINRLTRDGYTVRVPTRRRERHRDLLVNPRVQLIEANVYEPAVLRKLFADCTAVVNLVGILNEHGHHELGLGFDRAHIELPREIVEAMRASKVKRLLHMSALNAYPREEHSHYLRSKGLGEDLVHGAVHGLQVTSFRPSVIFVPVTASSTVSPRCCASRRWYSRWLAHPAVLHRCLSATSSRQWRAH